LEPWDEVGRGDWHGESRKSDGRRGIIDAVV
jgi:hypothetical protein